VNSQPEAAAVVVQRYFPSYDFVFRSRLSSREASDRLDDFFSQQERPRGFVILDPRVDGSVSGSTFSFSRRQAALGGSVRPRVDGYFVPEHDGVTVVARVQGPTFWWFFDVFMLVLFFVNFGLSWQSLLASPLVAALLVLLSIGPTWVEGPHAATLLRRLLAAAPVA
jgi:hypothetical protein